MKMTSWLLPVWALICLCGCKSEILINPTGSEYHCGLEEDCTIVCDSERSCGDIKFYVYNNSVSLQC